MQNTNYMVVIQQHQTASNTVITVNAPMPETFAFDTEASYETALPQGFTNNPFIKLAGMLTGTRLAVQALTAQLWQGNSAAQLSMELEFHTETDPVADVRTPVTNLLMMSMPSTSTSTGLLTSPGPSWDLSALTNLYNLANAASQAQTNSTTITANQLGTNAIPATMTNSNTSTANGASTSTASSQSPSLGTSAYWKSQVKNPIAIQLGNYLYFDSIVITQVQQTFSSNFDSITGLPHYVKVQVSFKPLFMLTQQDLPTLFINPGSTSATTNTNASIPAQAVGANTYGFSTSGTPNAFNFTT